MQNCQDQQKRQRLSQDCPDILKRRFQRSRKCHKCKDNRHIGNTPAGNLREKNAQKKLPVVYFTELLAEALGLREGKEDA